MILVPMVLVPPRKHQHHGKLQNCARWDLCSIFYYYFRHAGFLKALNRLKIQRVRGNINARKVFALRVKGSIDYVYSFISGEKLVTQDSGIVVMYGDDDPIVIITTNISAFMSFEIDDPRKMNRRKGCEATRKVRIHSV